MIDISQLSAANIGDWVEYNDGHGKVERGRLAPNQWGGGHHLARVKRGEAATVFPDEVIATETIEGKVCPKSSTEEALKYPACATRSLRPFATVRRSNVHGCSIHGRRLER